MLYFEHLLKSNKKNSSLFAEATNSVEHSQYGSRAKTHEKL